MWTIATFLTVSYTTFAAHHFHKNSELITNIKTAGMHPQVASRGEGLQLWRVAANTLNKQPWRAEKGWSSNLDVGHGGLRTPHHKNKPRISDGFFG
jgi:hypothetical protein